MSIKIKMIVAAAVVLASASAATAQVRHSQAQSQVRDWQYYQCVQDEGYGRTTTCDAGNSN